MLSKDIKHEQEKEKEEKQYLCNECGKLYKQLSSLHRHIKKNHSGENTKRHQCTYCSAKFHSKYQLTVHKFSNYNLFHFKP